MCRSYFFAFFACAIFSAASLFNAYYSLPAPEVSIVPPQAVALPNASLGVPTKASGDPEKVPAENSHSDTAANASNGPAVKKAFRPEGELSVLSKNLSQTRETRFFSPTGKLPASSEGIPADDPAQPETTPLNFRTDNFNILMLGVDGDKLEMVSVYSVNHRLKTARPKSVSLFFPINSLFIYKGKEKTLDGIFADRGWRSVAEVMEKEMLIDINYYVKIDRQALRDLEKYFDPIYVDGKKVEMENLFVRRTSDDDDRIIALILRQVLRPEVFFKYIPRLVFSFHRDIESNFSFTPKNLVFYYRLGKRLSTKRVEKVVLWGKTDWKNGRKVNIPPKDQLQCAIYLATKP